MTGSFSERAIARIKREWGKRSFDRVARAVLSTRPLSSRGASPLFLSMLCHRDMAAYLLAIKSLYSAFGQGQVVVIDDGSLTSGDLAILRRHVPGIETIDIAAIDTGPCPRGGTWERLVKIIELSADSYVIQADADTLTVGAIPEAVQCWRDNRSFLLGTGAGRDVQSALANARTVQGWITENKWTRLSVGVEAEAALHTLPDAAEKLYVHASSGFAGFARGAFALTDLQRFSLHMRGIMGNDRWNGWGTEQIASNYMLANAAQASVLPFPKYACFEPGFDPQIAPAFLHFIGTYRYRGGVYRKEVSRFLAGYREQ